MVFEDNGIYYMVLGAQTEDLKGRALIYKSEDIYKWSFAGELKTNMDDFGFMWECPNLFRISGNQFAFMFSPQGLKEEEFKYQNKFQSGYVIGEINLNHISLEHHTEFKEIDKGFDFYAPQVFNYEDKHILLGWIGMPNNECEYVSAEDGWIYGLTMPRALKYKDGAIYQEPLELLENLRESKIVDLETEIADSYKITLDSRTIECNLDLDMKYYNDLELKLKFTNESISIYYNKEEEICMLDRNNMELGGKGVRKFKLKADKSLKLHLFIDNSFIEIYYQDGLETTTFAYFPKYDDFEIEIKNKVNINKLQIWNLRRINYGK
nr:GH32 C-terminal domain-containing protein [Lacrimispora sp.]